MSLYEDADGTAHPTRAEREVSLDTLRAALAAWLRWYAPSAAELERAPAVCRPLLDEMAELSGAHRVARLASDIETANKRDMALAACAESRRMILEMACRELELCADTFDACCRAAVLRGVACGCGTAARNVRAVVARWREQVSP